MDILEDTIHDLSKALQGDMSGTQLATVQDTIRNYAIATAVAGFISGSVPGLAGILAMLTQTGLVWATYIKINQVLGISMKENTAKFIGSAIVTNVVTNVGTLILSYALATIISFIPIYGQAMAATANAAMGYIIIYSCAIIYLKLITDMVRPNGTIEIEATDDTKHIIKEIIERNNIKEIVREGRDNFKKVQKDGIIDEAVKHRRCPSCQVETEPNQKFCSKCGSPLS